MVNNKIADKDFDKNLSALSFFHNLRRHTAEGMFSDPVYGGNRNMVGWKLIGYPGAQRAYEPWEFQQEGTDRKPQSIMDMQAFNPGQPANADVALPVSGSKQ
jgi:gluconate 2-dehydrogenase gamma chain